MYDAALLKQLIRERALKFGDFTLASGKKASFYLDCKQVTLDSRGAVQIGAGLLALMGDRLPQCVGGMSIGADPIAASVVCMAGLRGIDLKGFMVRKEAKGHGTNRFIEGPVSPGDEAVIVEDVVTTGGSSVLAIERALEFGLRVTRVLAIVDRGQGGGEAFRQKGCEFFSLFTLRDFGIDGNVPAPTT